MAPEIMQKVVNVVCHEIEFHSNRKISILLSTLLSTHSSLTANLKENDTEGANNETHRFLRRVLFDEIIIKNGNSDIKRSEMTTSS